jgi:hypothetical protein
MMRASDLWDALWDTARAMQEARGPARRDAGAGIAPDDAGVRSLLGDLRAEYERRRRLGLPLALEGWLLGGDIVPHAEEPRVKSPRAVSEARERADSPAPRRA